ncbi:hypothetical protein M8J75_007381 [Diaphorina citri]|nr:hypothetical protein M8J75_007381 [Diaphorina citri]
MDINQRTSVTKAITDVAKSTTDLKATDDLLRDIQINSQRRELFRSVGLSLGQSAHQLGQMNAVGNFAQPGGIFGQPKGNLAQSEGNLAQPDGNFAQPKGNLAHHGGSFAQPVGNFAHRGGNLPCESHESFESPSDPKRADIGDVGHGIYLPIVPEDINVWSPQEMHPDQRHSFRDFFTKI